MDKDENKFGLYFNAKGSNLSTGTTEQLKDLLSDIELGEFDDEPTAEAIKVVLKEQEDSWKRQLLDIKRQLLDIFNTGGNHLN
jgi:hypothetical protein